jgi:hypothetical protein
MKAKCVHTISPLIFRGRAAKIPSKESVKFYEIQWEFRIKAMCAVMSVSVCGRSRVVAVVDERVGSSLIPQKPVQTCLQTQIPLKSIDFPIHLVTRGVPPSSNSCKYCNDPIKDLVHSTLPVMIKTVNGHRFLKILQSKLNIFH